MDPVYWKNFILPYGQVRIRVGPAGRNDRWSDWLVMTPVPDQPFVGGGQLVIRVPVRRAGRPRYSPESPGRKERWKPCDRCRESGGEHWIGDAIEQPHRLGRQAQA